MSENITTNWQINKGIGFLSISKIEDILNHRQVIDNSVENDEIRCIVFLLDTSHTFYDQEEFKNEVFTLLNTFPLPTIVYIDNQCSGVQLEIAMMCDMRLGGENLKVQFIKAYPFDKYAFDFTERCRLLMGREGDMDYTYLFEQEFDSEAAAKIRFINQIIDSHTMMHDIQAYIEKILTNKEMYQIKSIIRCFKHYKNIPFCFDRELLLEQETSQFCYLVYKDYHKNEINSNEEKK